MFRFVPLLALGTMMMLASAHAEQVTVNVVKRHQAIVGWGSCMIFWRLSETPYDNPAWRRAFRDLGLNILRVMMKKDVLVDANGDMSVPVPLGSDIQSNIAKMDFSKPAVKVYGDMAAWLARNALEPDRVKVSAAIYSPPHWMKGPTGFTQHHVKNPSLKKPTPWLSDGNQGDSIGGRLLQTPSNIVQFARYMAAWVKGFELHYEVPVYVASLQNELSFENPFDSATYALGPEGEKKQWWQYAAMLKAVKDEFALEQIKTRVMGPHMGNVGKHPSRPSGLWQQMSFIEAVREHSDPQLIDFLSFYNSNGYLGTDEGAVKMWAGYYLGKAAVPADWPAWLHAPGVARDQKPIWISEAGGEKATWLAGGGSPGKGAITVALKMHNALVYANSSTYVYWQLSDTNREETQHTLLGKKHIDNPTKSKKYSAFKHFSRYIRPGAIRVGATFINGKNSSGGASEYDTFHSLNVSAYLHEADHRLTVVLINMKATPEVVAIRLPEALGIESLEVYATSNTANFLRQRGLAVASGRASLTIPAHSILTLYGVTTELSTTSQQAELPYRKKQISISNSAVVPH